MTNLRMTHPDRAALARVGRDLRTRLEADPGAYRVPADGAEIWAFGDFLEPAECTRLMTMIDAVAEPSALHTAVYVEDFRTSWSGNLDRTDPFIRRIARRIDDRIGIDPRWGEAIQGQRYAPGQQFKPHFDWFDERAAYWAEERARGGQRSITAMAYLNAVPEGGATHFTELGFEIAPTPGALLVWNNANEDGTVNERMLHAGLPPVRGDKYVITRWYRTRNWE